MCTLTYVNLGIDKYVITVNRDESPLRNAKSLSEYRTKKGALYFMPKEPVKGGTNVAINPKGRVSVLLNGAFKPHKMGGIYRESRGIILLNSLEVGDIFEYFDEDSLSDIEPFTLVDFQSSIREIRWDGKTVFRKEYSNNEPHIWASAQLYSPEVIQKRENWFSAVLSGNTDEESIMNFHKNGGDGDSENDLVMNRGNMVRTVSITQFVHSPEIQSIKHLNLIDNEEKAWKSNS